jgi:hypothetical protein
MHATNRYVTPQNAQISAVIGPLLDPQNFGFTHAITLA